MPYICLMQESASSFPRLIDHAHQNGYNVVAAPLNSMEMPYEFERPPMCENQQEFTYSDLLLNADQWNNKVIGLLSEHIDCDSTDPAERKRSERILQRDISWAQHLQYCGHTMVRLKSGRVLNLARIVTAKVNGFVLVQVPLYNSRLEQATWRSDVDEEQLAELEAEDPWQWWNRFRLAADCHAKLKVVLELNEGELPHEDVVRRWLGEPLEAIILPASIFVRNRHNYPVLPKAWQGVMAHFLRAHVNLIVSTGSEDNCLKMYYEYLQGIRELQNDDHQLANFEDMLEVPLQPLNDNLDCYTYEIFEKDPVKYKLYQDAIEAALIDRVKDDEIDEKVTIVMVLGAGRGPLVRSTLNAAENTKRKVRVYIIEKNPNAIRTLTSIAKKLWHNKDVKIFSKDMREFSPPEQADILVSELLGSFGDNELSPECLDCGQNLLKPDGISIPNKSISFINPIMSMKLFNAVRQAVRTEAFSRDKITTYHNHAESGFVVMLKNIYNIGLPQPLFEFVHPNHAQKPIDNSRYQVLSFEVTLDCIINGIAGYFEAVLYKDIIISINPPTHTAGMHSWFPMYFPFTEPINVKQGQIVEIHFWRCVSKQKIWYEWCMSSPVQTHVHNQGGRSCPIYCT